MWRLLLLLLQIDCWPLCLFVCVHCSPTAVTATVTCVFNSQICQNQDTVIKAQTDSHMFTVASNVAVAPAEYSQQQPSVIFLA
jgi:hypothetical protein